MKKVISILALAFAIIMTFVSCSSSYGGTKEDKTVVAKCGDEEIYLEEYRYLYYAHLSDMIDEFGDGIFDGEKKEEYFEILQERIKNDIITYSTLVAIGKECDLYMNKGEIKEYVEETIDELIDYFESKEAYIQNLKNDHITHDFFKYLLGITYISENLFDAMVDNGKISAPTDKDELIALLESKMFKTTHVYLPFNYGGKTKEENRLKIDGIYDSLKSGEISFSEAIYDGCTDTSLSSGGNEYFVGYTELIYEETALSLEENEYSGVIEMNDAFYIVMRLPLDKTHIENDPYALREDYLATLYNAYMTDYSSKLSFELYDVSMVK